MAGSRRGGHAVLAAALAAALAACAGPRYAPCPVELDGPLPPDAFATCQRVLGTRYGVLAVVDPERFLMQSPWVPVGDPPGERRASVFRDGGGLAVVVELRWLTSPLVGLPGWSPARGDAAAERELAETLRSALANRAPAGR